MELSYLQLLLQLLLFAVTIIYNIYYLQWLLQLLLLSTIIIIYYFCHLQVLIDLFGREEILAK